MCRFYQPDIERIISISGVDPVEIGCSIAMVALSRVVVFGERIDPESGNAEILEVVEPVDDALNVSSVPAIRIGSVYVMLEHACDGIVRWVPIGKPVRRDKIDDVGACEALVPAFGVFPAEDRVGKARRAR